jgi:hypothetical protein
VMKSLPALLGRTAVSEAEPVPVGSV